MLLRMLLFTKALLTARSFSSTTAHRIHRHSTAALFATSTKNMNEAYQVSNFIDTTNANYESLHKAFELQFWGTKMALSGSQYSTAELTRTKIEM